ncbi:YtxH domain-containing protein [Actinomadura barringtoniae]|uniref:YtxH domain-containing protein n=1 Tax=Actinomadura barringtoniae TaxID=1427535 RepID=A0A939T0Y6_9ACTN|nr:YtxH domain-containing protein [Actinomadura barringtoniae]MBO2446421.1 YtxH domain-containing protein [Actinomadura barringtoniae]
MKYRVPFIAGAAIGYVLGTKAGRERYEQIKNASKKVAESQKVHETAGLIMTKGGEIAEVAKVKAVGAGHKVGEKVRRSPVPEEELDPEQVPVKS